MRIDPDKYTDHIVNLQKKISAAKQDVEFSNELIARTADTKTKNELQQKNKLREQGIANMTSQIHGTIDSRARDSYFPSK